MVSNCLESEILPKKKVYYLVITGFLTLLLFKLFVVVDLHNVLKANTQKSMYTCLSYHHRKGVIRQSIQGLFNLYQNIENYLNTNFVKIGLKIGNKNNRKLTIDSLSIFKEVMSMQTECFHLEIVRVYILTNFCVI
ncbi:hypothetical protein BpHYR1_000016 [Brachionus plicatilis]|uniref:Uncharacterized protein n=1 Tax=Brachionus plicatilis TaxID=10195 RepID=A0A3M7RY12_BRAPC|nr:hypothetical protein BpHYR1_000016 [Brachionus plicatilis]